jgi:hypothetical protein
MPLGANLLHFGLRLSIVRALLTALDPSERLSYFLANAMPFFVPSDLHLNRPGRDAYALTPESDVDHSEHNSED